MRHTHTHHTHIHASVLLRSRACPIYPNGIHIRPRDPRAAMIVCTHTGIRTHTVVAIIISTHTSARTPGMIIFAHTSECTDTRAQCCNYYIHAHVCSRSSASYARSHTTAPDTRALAIIIFTDTSARSPATLMIGICIILKRTRVVRAHSELTHRRMLHTHHIDSTHTSTRTAVMIIFAHAHARTHGGAAQECRFAARGLPFLASGCIKDSGAYTELLDKVSVFGWFHSRMPIAGGPMSLPLLTVIA